MQWSEETYRLDQIVDKFSLPRVICFSEGYYTEDEDGFAAGDILKIDKHVTLHKVAAHFVSEQYNSYVNAWKEEILVPLKYNGKLTVKNESKEYQNIRALVKDLPRYAKVLDGVGIKTQQGEEVNVPPGTVIELDRIVPADRSHVAERLVVTFTSPFGAVWGTIPLSASCNMRSEPDFNHYTIREVVERYQLPRVVCFVGGELKQVYTTDLSEAIDNLKHFTADTLRLNRVVQQSVLVCHYKALGDSPDPSTQPSRTPLMLLPMDMPYIIRELQVQVLNEEEVEYERILFTNASQSADMNAVDGSLYVEFARLPRRIKLSALDMPRDVTTSSGSDRDTTGRPATSVPRTASKSARKPRIPTPPIESESLQEERDDYLHPITSLKKSAPVKPSPRTADVNLSDDDEYEYPENPKTETDQEGDRQSSKAQTRLTPTVPSKPTNLTATASKEVYKFPKSPPPVPRKGQSGDRHLLKPQTPLKSKVPSKPINLAATTSQEDRDVYKIPKIPIRVHRAGLSAPVKPSPRPEDVNLSDDGDYEIPENPKTETDKKGDRQPSKQTPLTNKVPSKPTNLTATTSQEYSKVHKFPRSPPPHVPKTGQSVDLPVKSEKTGKSYATKLFKALTINRSTASDKKSPTGLTSPKYLTSRSVVPAADDHRPTHAHTPKRMSPPSPDVPSDDDLYEKIGDLDTDAFGYLLMDQWNPPQHEYKTHTPKAKATPKKLPAKLKDICSRPVAQVRPQNVVSDGNSVNADRQGNVKQFDTLRKTELVDRLRMCSMDHLADVCATESIDGKFLSTLSEEDLRAPPFSLSQFEVTVKLKQVKNNWIPK